MVLTAVLLVAVCGCRGYTVDVHPHSQDSLMQSWSKALDGTNTQETPITRLVNILTEMQGTLKKEMDEDEELYEKTVCWCNTNKRQKSQAIETAEGQIAMLESSIEELTGKSADLKSLITETTAELEADKEELAQATALRQQQLKAFQAYELDAIQNIETLKAAIVVLGKHQAAFPQVSLLGLGSRHKRKWATSIDGQFDRFLSQNDFSVEQDTMAMQVADHAYSEFVKNQEAASAPTPSEAAETISSHHDEAVEEKPDIPLDRQFDHFLGDNGFGDKGSAVIQEADNAYSDFLQSHVPASAPAPSEAAETIPSAHEAIERKADPPLDQNLNHFLGGNNFAMGQDSVMEAPLDIQAADHAQNKMTALAPTPIEPDKTIVPRYDQAEDLEDNTPSSDFDHVASTDDFATRGSASTQPVTQARQEWTTTSAPSTLAPTTSQLLARAETIWSHHDEAVVAKAIHSASLFLQAHGRAAYTQSGAQSGEILGVMKQLKEEMEEDLSEAQKEEAERAGSFQELRSAKTAEIAAGEGILEKNKPELAKTKFDLANDKEDLSGLQAQLPEDQKFLSNLIQTCDKADKNFVVRKKSRLDEIKAVSETIEILTSDEAKDTFSGAFKFLQVEQSSRIARGRRALAASMLRKTAMKTGNPELSALATSVELDAFTEVKAAIDTMIGTLKIQQSDEVKKKDWCNMEFDENSMQTTKAENLKQDLATSIEDRNVVMKTLTDEIAAAKMQISDMQVDLQRAAQNRVKENADFQKTVADQVATQKILAQALEKLAAFYDSKMLVQVGHKDSKQNAIQLPTPETEYKKNAGANSVMSLVEKLYYDAKELEKESRTAENEAEAQYQTFLEDTNASVKELQGAVVTKSESKAKADKELVETKEALSSTLTDLEDLAKYKTALRKDCDFLLKNIGIRQEARAAEIEGLQQAKQILSGAMQ